MTAPYSFPKLRRETVGRPGSRLSRENLYVLPRIAYNAAAGVQRTSRQACSLCTGGFSHLGRQTEREKIPSPRKKSVVTTMDREVMFLVHFPRRNFLAEAAQPLNH